MTKTTIKDITEKSKVKTKAKSHRFELHNASEALEPQPPIDWLIQNLITAGSVNIVVGEPGSKKTWAMLDMGICIALGKAWLDYPTSQGAVLIVDEESGNQRLKRRIGNILRGHLADKDKTIPSLYWTSLSALDLGKVDDINQLQILIMNTGAKLVIIDALVDVMPDKDENSAKDTQQIFSALRALSDLLNVSFVVIHHLNKMGRTRGSTAISGSVDLILQVESKATSNLITFKTEKARDIEGTTFHANANFGPKDGNGQFWLTGRDAPQETIHFNSGQRHILKYLLKHGQSEKQKIIDAADTTTVKNAFGNLVENGFIERANEGTQGKKAEYILTDKGKKNAEKL